MKLSSFLSVVKKPELCEAGRWFKRDKKTGKYHGACPIAKAATKRGFRYKGGAKAADSIAKRFELDTHEIATFTREWDTRVRSLKRDHAKPNKKGIYTAQALSKVDLTSTELRIAFKQAVRHASPPRPRKAKTVIPVTTSYPSYL